MNIKTPRNLYKYLTFNENTIEMLIMHQAYFSDPINFNDPMDCKPIIKVDVDETTLERVVCNLIRKRSEKDFSQMAKKLKMSEEATENRTRALSESEVLSFLNEVSYYSGESEIKDVKNYKINRYKYAIQNEILSVFKRGVLCLSRKFDSPLMWSHYANNHKGLCIEYDMENVSEDMVKKIIYGGSRELKVSLIDDWLRHGELKSEITDVCLLTKSSDWSYEVEWRMFGEVGVQDIYPTLKSVIFGMHCKQTTIASVIKTLSNKNRKIKFWKIYNEGVGFELKRTQLNPSDYENMYNNTLSISEMHAILNDLDN
ncbi:DUF2971 domain-containing protein [Atlantibacter hermannii]|uniref:DUF2971 domain-containing protein n=1 Tax=Atlantibacter hermannii TaxID=565 RepID=UPI002896CB9E|nr:DUF2971 domain-containing protein [Atlantibacter hermannii]